MLITVATAVLKSNLTLNVAGLVNPEKAADAPVGPSAILIVQPSSSPA